MSLSQKFFPKATDTIMGADKPEETLKKFVAVSPDISSPVLEKSSCAGGPAVAVYV